MNNYMMCYRIGRLEDLYDLVMSGKVESGSVIISCDLDRPVVFEDLIESDHDVDLDISTGYRLYGEFITLSDDEQSAYWKWSTENNRVEILKYMAVKLCASLLDFRINLSLMAKNITGKSIREQSIDMTNCKYGDVIAIEYYPAIVRQNLKDKPGEFFDISHVFDIASNFDKSFGEPNRFMLIPEEVLKIVKNKQ